MKALKSAITIAIVAGIAIAGYQYLNPAPCTRPIAYSIGSFDPKFGISQTQFLADVATAAQIWDDALGRDIFLGSADGKLKIDLIYDYRQQATAKMQSIGLVINDDKSSYDALKARYDQLKAQYETDKAGLVATKATYEAEKASYDQQVEYWNSRGGAPKAQYAALEAERNKLNSGTVSLNQSIAALNDLVVTVNSASTVLNRLVGELNLNVSSYNAIGQSTGPEFNEGEYVEDASGKHINIYEFSNNDQLIRVLAHELGHALGLEHVDDPKAIMYRLNQSTNEKPTAADLTELMAVCGAH